MFNTAYWITVAMIRHFSFSSFVSYSLSPDLTNASLGTEPREVSCLRSEQKGMSIRSPGQLLVGPWPRAHYGMRRNKSAS